MSTSRSKHIAQHATAIVAIFFSSLYALNASAQTQVIRFLQYQSVLPIDWVAEKPSSSMRLSQYRVASDQGDNQAAFIVYYFGQGQGGPIDANITRWRSQFTSADGAPVTPAVNTMTVQSMPITTVELRGTYGRGVGVGPVGKPLADQVLHAAIIQTPQGNVTVQLHGPASTVDAQHSAFLAFLNAIQ